MKGKIICAVRCNTFRAIYMKRGCYCSSRIARDGAKNLTFNNCYRAFAPNGATFYFIQDMGTRQVLNERKRVQLSI